MYIAKKLKKPIAIKITPFISVLSISFSSFLFFLNQYIEYPKLPKSPTQASNIKAFPVFGFTAGFSTLQVY